MDGQGGKQSTSPIWMVALFVQLYSLVPYIPHLACRSWSFSYRERSVSQLQNWLRRLIIFIAVLNTFFLTKPLSGLNLWSQKNVSRSQPHLMRWVWGCWPAKRPLRQNRLSESRWEICMRALASSCQNTCSCETAWHGCKSFSAPFWGAQVILWAETLIVNWTWNKGALSCTYQVSWDTKRILCSYRCVSVICTLMLLGSVGL